MREIIERIKWWFTPHKKCYHCCVICEYFSNCKQEGIQ